MDGVRLTAGVTVRIGRAEELATELATHLARPGKDPFAVETVCVDNPGMVRWLSGRLSQHLGVDRGGDGVCAGISMPALSGFVEHTIRSLTAIDIHSDPWANRHLTGKVLSVMRRSVGEPWFEVLGHHLGDPGDPTRPGRWYDTAARIARLFRRYWTHRPNMLAAWALAASESTADLGAAQWQAHLWRQLSATTSVPSPVERLAMVADRLNHGSGDPAQRLFVFHPHTLSPRECEFLHIYSRAHQVWVGLIDAPATPPHHRLASTYATQATHVHAALTQLAGTEPASPAATGTSSHRSDTILHALQGHIVTGTPSPSPHDLRDDSVQIHQSHGHDRQVEVLREVLTGLFADDTSLQPRDVLVVSPVAQQLAPLVSAAFTLPPHATSTHPGHSLRVRVTDGTSTDANPLLHSLIGILEAVTGRMTLSDLFDLARMLPVRRRFHLTEDDLSDVYDLLQAAGARWGLDSADRQRFGLGDLHANTISAGLDRLLLGIVMSEEGAPIIGNTLPLDGVDSTRVGAVGGLAELVDRLGHLAAMSDLRRTAGDWANTIREASRLLFDPGPADAWQASALATTAADLAQLTNPDTTWSLGDVMAFLRDARSTTMRPSGFGTGALVVTDLSSARCVPHRVVVIVGLDEQSFPRVNRSDGDDLLIEEPHPLDFDYRHRDQQAFYDAIMAAREKFIVIGQAIDPRTNTAVPEAPAVRDLRAAVHEVAPQIGERLTTKHALYPYSPASFSTATGSFDASAHAAATSQANTAPTQWRAVDSTAVQPGGLSLRALLGFLRHPLRELLRVQCGLPVYDDAGAATDIPIELDGLQRWEIGNRMLTATLTGQSLESVSAAERVRGTLPPGDLGEGVLTGVSDQVRRRLAAVDALPHGETIRRDVAISLDGWLVSGTIETVDADIRLVRYSSLTPAVRLEAWVSLLLLAANAPGERWTATAITSSGETTWASDRIDARGHLQQLLRIYQLGMSGPIPLPAKTSLVYAQDKFLGRDDEAWNQAESTWRDESTRDRWWPQYYSSFADVRDQPFPTDWTLRRDTTLFGTLARTVWTPALSGERP